jgi:hypothetical protein
VQKLVEMAQKNATSKPQARKKGRTQVVPDLNEDDPDKDLQDQARVQDA